MSDVARRRSTRSSRATRSSGSRTSRRRRASYSSRSRTWATRLSPSRARSRCSGSSSASSRTRTSAIAYHTRKHGFSDRPEYVLVQGRGSLTPVEDRDWVDRHRDDMGPLRRPASAEPLYGVVAARVPLARRYPARHRPRAWSWPDLACTASPRSTALRFRTRRRAAEAHRPRGRGRGSGTSGRHEGREGLPHVLLGWVGGDGFPMVVPGRSPRSRRSRDAAAGARRPDARRRSARRAPGARLRASTRPARISPSTRAGSSPSSDGAAVYAPHTQAGYRMPRVEGASSERLVRRGDEMAHAAGAARRLHPVTILGFDTSTAASTRRRAAPDGELFEVPRRPGGSPSGPRTPTELLPAIGEVMERAEVGFADLDAIAVGRGPGHLHRAADRRRDGARAGEGERPAACAACRRSPRSRPGCRSELRLPLIDAKRGEVYAALFEGDARALAAGRARHRRRCSSGLREAACNPAGGRRRLATISRRTGSRRRGGGARGFPASRRERGAPLQARTRSAGRRHRSRSSPTTCASQTQYRDERNLEIRRLTYSDLPHVIAIERRAFPTPWSLSMFVLELSKPSGICLAAIAERAAGRLPRLLALRHRLAPDERGGRSRAAARGHRQHADDAPLRHGRPPARAVHARGAASRTTRAIALYERFGFRGAGHRRAYYHDNREDALIMWRTAAGGARGHGLILGIETSCDDTCAALVTRDGAIRANVIASQGLLHERYGGVVPEIASRQHLEVLDSVVDDTLERAGATLDDVEDGGRHPRPGPDRRAAGGPVDARRPWPPSRRLPLVPVDHLHGHVTASHARRGPDRAAVPRARRQRRAHLPRARGRPERVPRARRDARRRRGRGVRQGRAPARAGLSRAARRSTGSRATATRRRSTSRARSRATGWTSRSAG